jgi:hypothetical protein
MDSNRLPHYIKQLVVFRSCRSLYLLMRKISHVVFRADVVAAFQDDLQEWQLPVADLAARARSYHAA